MQKAKKAPNSGLAAAGFISFADVTGDTPAKQARAASGGESSGLAVAVYQGGHAELGMHCKKVLKKDLVTKMKALQEIANIISMEAAAISASTESNELLAGFIPFFAFLFPKLAMENEWKVRERFGALLFAIVTVNRLSVRPVLKDIIGPWFQLMNDPVREISDSFRRSFSACVPDPRKCILNNSHALITYLGRSLGLTTLELREQWPSISDEELEEKKDRIAFCSVLSLAQILTILRPATSRKGKLATATVVAAVEEEETTAAATAATEAVLNKLQDIIGSRCLRLAGSAQWKLRDAVFQLLVEISTHFSSLLVQCMAGVAQSLLEGLSQASNSNVGVDSALAAWATIPSKLADKGFWTIGAGAVLKKVLALRSTHADAVSDHLLSIVAGLPAECCSLQNPSVASGSGAKVLTMLTTQLKDWLDSVGASPVAPRNFKVIIAVLEVSVYVLLRNPSNPAQLESDGATHHKALLQLLTDGASLAIIDCISRPDRDHQELHRVVMRTVGIMDRSPFSQQYSELLFPLIQHHMESATMAEQHRLIALLGDSWQVAGKNPSSGIASMLLRTTEMALSYLGSTDASTVCKGLALAGCLSSTVPSCRDAIQSIKSNVWSPVSAVIGWFRVLVEATEDLDEEESAVLSTWTNCQASMPSNCTEIVHAIFEEVHNVVETSPQSVVFLKTLVRCLTHRNAEDAMPWKSAHALATQCLQGSVPLQAALQYLLSLHTMTHPSAIALCADMVVQATRLIQDMNWPAPVGTAVWYLLSLWAVELQKGTGGGNGGLDESCLRVLPMLFWSRDMHSFPSSPRQSKEFPLQALQQREACVMEWSHIEEYILPHLSDSALLSLGQEIAHRLNAQLCRSPQAQHVSSRLWAGHASQFLKLTSRFPRVAMPSLTVFTVRFWEDDHAEHWDFALQCLEEMIRECKEMVYHVLGRSEGLLWSILRVVLARKKGVCIAADGRTLARRTYRHLRELLGHNVSEGQREALLLSLMNWMDRRVLQEKDREVLRALEPLQELLDEVVSAWSMDCSSLAPLQLCTPLPHLSALLLHTTSVKYLSITTASSQAGPIAPTEEKQEGAEAVQASVTYRLEPCEIRGVHLENGLYQPYYTVAISNREVQTEWHRLILYPSHPSSAGDILCVPSEQSVAAASDAAGADGAASGSEQSTGTACVEWFHRALLALQVLVVDLQGPRAAAVARQQNWFQWVLRAMGLAVVYPFLATHEDMHHVTPQLRGLVVECVRLQSRYPWLGILASKLLDGVLRVQAGRGDGLWLPPMMSFIWQDLMKHSNASDMRNSSDGSNAGSPAGTCSDSLLPTSWCLLLTAMLRHVQWNTLIDITARYAIPSLLASTATPEALVVACLAAWWKNHAGTSGENSRGSAYDDHCVQSRVLHWEGQGVDRVASLFLSLVSPVPTERPTLSLLVTLLHALQMVFDRPVAGQQALLASTTLPASLSAWISILAMTRPSEQYSLLADRFDQALVDSIQLCAAKILDSLQGLVVRERLQSLLAKREAASGKTGEQMGEEEKSAEAEAAEEKEVFHAMVGDELLCLLHDCFPSSSEAFSALAGRDEGEDGGDGHEGEERDNDQEEEDEEEEGEDAEQERQERSEGDRPEKAAGATSLQPTVSPHLPALAFEADEASRWIPASPPSAPAAAARSVSWLASLPSKQRQAYQRDYCRRWSAHHPVRSVLTWLVVLQAIDHACTSQLLEQARTDCGSYLKSRGWFVLALHCLLHVSGSFKGPKLTSSLLSRATFIHFSHPMGSSLSLSDLAHLAVYRSLTVLPSLFRFFFTNFCPRHEKVLLTRFVEDRGRGLILQREMQWIQIAQQAYQWNEEVFKVQGSVLTGEIRASLLHDETKVEVVIKLPTCYPLKNVEVIGQTRMGVSEGRWRRWMVQMIRLLSCQDQAVVEAAWLWKQNIEEELRGVEPCPICYCTLHNKTLKIPSFKCPTCSNKFHPSCLFTWFKSSGKSNCVLCQQPLFH